MAKRKVDWSGEDVISVLSDRSLTLSKMAMKIGVKSIYNVSRMRKKLGITERVYGNGLGRAMTNQERKKRYNEKLKANGWKPLNFQKYE